MSEIKQEETKSSSSVISFDSISSIVWFLFIYLLIYIIFGFFVQNKIDFDQYISKTLDLCIFGFVLLVGCTALFTMSSAEINAFLTDLWGKFKAFVENTPFSIFPLTLFIIAFYLVIYVLRIPMETSKPFSISIVETITWGLLIFLITKTFLKQVWNIDIWTFFFPLPPPKPETATPIDKKEVFHISNNLYTYKDAQAVCKLFNARLANYDDIEKAYQNGAEFNSSYGWSADQFAYFITQKKTFDELQKNPNTKNNAGRPGVNGGYMANPELKFGVNCFGEKPAPTEGDKIATERQETLPFVSTNPEDVEIEAKMKYFAENKDTLLQINQFNKNKWSEF